MQSPPAKLGLVSPAQCGLCRCIFSPGDTGGAGEIMCRSGVVAGAEADVSVRAERGRSFFESSADDAERAVPEPDL